MIMVARVWTSWAAWKISINFSTLPRIFQQLWHIMEHIGESGHLPEGWYIFFIFCDIPTKGAWVYRAAADKLQHNFSPVVKNLTSTHLFGNLHKIVHETTISMSHLCKFVEKSWFTHHYITKVQPGCSYPVFPVIMSRAKHERKKSLFQ